MSVGPDQPSEQGTSVHERGTSAAERGTSVAERGTKAAPERESLVGLAVEGATQRNVTGERNWAAVKKSGVDVLVKAETAPNNDLAEWKKIRWTTGNPVPGHPNHRKISRATSKKYHVEASLGGSSAYVDVWIIWAKVVILTNGMRPTNSAPFTTGMGVRDGTQRLGAVKYDTLQGAVIDEEAGIVVDRIGATGKVCPVATLTPKQISTVIRSGWEFKREIQCHDFRDGIKDEHSKSWKGTWVDDPSDPELLRLTPDASDKIYDLDAPNIPNGNTSGETYNNFRQWIEFNGEHCSDYAPWYWRARWKLNRDPPKQVTLKDLGTGQVKLPAKPYYPSK